MNYLKFSWLVLKKDTTPNRLICMNCGDIEFLPVDIISKFELKEYFSAFSNKHEGCGS